MFNHKIVLKNKKLKFVETQTNVKKNQVVINVKSCGICGSDLKILKYGSKRVKDNVVLGHEVSGQILDFKKNFVIKKNIILGADIPSKKYKDFAIGHEIDGGFQKFLLLDKKILEKIPHVITNKKIDYDIASLTEPLACCINGMEKVKFQKNTNTIIYGAGPIGYLLSTLLIYHGAKKVFLIDSNSLRLKIGPSYKNLYKLGVKNYEKKINYDIASLTEPLACCINGMEKVKFKKNTNTIIYGAGPIGYLLSTLLIYHGAKKVFLVDGNSLRLKIGPSHKNLYKLNLKNYENEIKKILKTKEKIEYGFVACNSPEAQQSVLRIVDNGGVINYFSGIKQGKNKVSVSLDTNLIHYKELSLVGSHGSKKEHILKAAKLIINNKLRLKKIITNIYDIKNYDLAFKKSENADCLKVVINP